MHKLQQEIQNTLEMDKCFETIDALNEIRTKMETNISNQSHIDLLKKFDQFKHTIVRIEKEQITINFSIKVKDMYKTDETPFKFESEDKGLCFTIIKNDHNTDAFDVYLEMQHISSPNRKIIPKISLKPFKESGIVMGGLESFLTSTKPKEKIAKILVLNSESVDQEDQLEISCKLEELENIEQKNKEDIKASDANELGNDNIELNMLLGLQGEISKLILENIIRNKK